MRQLARLKKMLAGVIAAAMVFTTGVSVASASETTDTTSEKGKITITGAIDGVSYDLYRIFDFEGSTVSDNGAYAEGVYKLSDKWSAFTSSYFTVNADGTLTFNNFKEETDAKVFAKEAMAFVSANGIAADYTREDADTDADSTIVFEGVELGYYLVDSSVGTLLSLDTTTTEASIAEKNEVPTVDKEVLDDYTGSDEYKKSNDAGVGDTVTFQVTIHAKAGAQNYVLHEVMSKGLSFNEITKVVLKNGDNVIDMTETFNEMKDQALTLNPTHEDGRVDTFDLSICQDCLDLITNDMDIVITYTATVTSDAVVDGSETNDVKLTYGDDHETEWDETTTYNYSFNLKKYSASDSTSANLAGAKFKLLLSDSDDAEAVKLVAMDDENTYRVATDDDSDTATIEEFTTTATGDIVIKGLDAGTYYLEETEAPSGYNKLTSRVKVIISRANDDADGNYFVNEREDHTVLIANGTGAVLPSTGGIGTTIFYIVGGILIIAALAWFIVRRKSENE